MQTHIDIHHKPNPSTLRFVPASYEIQSINDAIEDMLPHISWLNSADQPIIKGSPGSSLLERLNVLVLCISLAHLKLLGLGVWRWVQPSLQFGVMHVIPGQSCNIMMHDMFR